MFCKNCGAQLNDAAAFCTDCGTPVSVTAASVESAYTQPPAGESESLGSYSQPAENPAPAENAPVSEPEPAPYYAPAAPQPREPAAQSGYDSGYPIAPACPPAPPAEKIPSVLSYIGWFILSALPGIGFILSIVFAVDGNNKIRANFFRAILAMMAVGLVLSVVVIVLIGIFSVSLAGIASELTEEIGAEFYGLI